MICAIRARATRARRHAASRWPARHGSRLRTRLGRRPGSVRETLEPRLVYSYVPYRNQDDLPIFDTALPDLNITDCIRTNRYVGGDRIGDANQLSMGLTTRLFGQPTGQQYLSATLGQTRYFTQPRVTLPGETPPLTARRTSSAKSRLTAYRNCSVKHRLSVESVRQQTEKSEVSVQYHARHPSASSTWDTASNTVSSTNGTAPSHGRSRSIGTLSAAWSIRSRTSKRSSTWPESSTRSCCWRFEVVQRRYVMNRIRRPGHVDCGAIGTHRLEFGRKAASSFLQRSISGYSAVNPSP